MPMLLKGEKYYWTSEACKLAGISKNTFLRWVRHGAFPDVQHRDRRGWRIFSKHEVDRLMTEVQKVEMPENKNKGAPMHI
jgi:excisionase family DNA binding protein